MNKPIIRVYAFVLLLFASLVWFTSKWTVFDSDELQAKTQNRRPLIEEQEIPRGSITTADGVLIAESKPEGGGNHPVYVRDYPDDNPEAFGNPVGYSFVTAGNRTGIEASENDLLAGEKNEFASIIDQLTSTPQQGADITLTLNAEAQRLAVAQLQSAIASTPGASGFGGSVVALNPQTGAVEVMASVPGFDPNDLRDPKVASQLQEEGVASPLFNRPTQGTYEPGSTMKVVTAAAALDSGEFTPDSVLSGQTGIEIGGVPLENAGGESPGDINMDTALTHSVNTYFAQVGEKLGTQTMFEYMDRFGFFHDPQLDYPDIQMQPSGVYDGGDLLGAGDAIDIGRVAIGQERLLVTPMQMAEVAATIANGGTLMKPTFLQSAKDPDGRTIDELNPSEQSQVVSSETANQLTEMMTHVTEEGTAAGLTVQGISFAGKTGTAEVDVENGINRPWFIGFAPAQDPQVAVAVMLERCQGCFGGEVAGPIATQIMESLLN
ncbi:MAG: penicillin-binding protein [Solirubrobacterales bacterium]|nr:penicillin-binding protein [Solirubrobacterales bacterium]